MTSIPDSTVGEDYWNSGLEVTGTKNLHLEVAVTRIQLEVVAVTLKVTWLREVLPMASRVFDPYENPVT
jgi:hypothetical protein